MNPWGEAQSPYVEMGGDEGVRELVEAFYDIIEEESPSLRAMLPRNTATSRQKLHEYLSGWLGGPPLYEMKRGHPQLRRRHFPFEIGGAEADEWMRCMRLATERVGLGDRLSGWLDERLEPLARHMINR